ncbi:diguanylate cyclase domain-containing protein [Chitiniphilus eburneus]|uniref:GGDEF domain-containing protein n=1 Tax=Chitiniphilus eburneus TaxID=2571148 RepID=A0A4U0QC19_9NEIS|nr:GGDEF domain-containing protein [Chitiniphilus eburneus]TJZ78939.1 GGDEF domain-containing protein [Chitiniphilus eburneus]
MQDFLLPLTLLAAIALAGAAWTILQLSKRRTALRRIREEAGELRPQAEYDPETGLPTRALLYHRLHRAITAPTATHAFTVALVRIPDAAGQARMAGLGAERALWAAAFNRLASVLREGDIVARWDAESLALHVSSQLDAIRLDETLRIALGQVLVMPERHLALNVEVGTSAFPTDGRAPGLLLAEATHRLRPVVAAG